MGYGATIKVVGVGGAGGNALLTMFRGGIGGIERIAMNTDAQAVAHVADEAHARALQLGPRITRGLGAGGRPQVGMEAANESKASIAALLRGADLVFVTAGMGGGTGTGAAPVVADVARDLGALVVGVVTRPFRFEGRRRRSYAAQGLEALAPALDSLLVIENDRLLQAAGGELSMVEAFRAADTVLGNAVRGVSDLVTLGGLINVDLADLRAVLLDGGRAIMGVGEAREGEGGAREAVRRAMTCPLLDDDSIVGARGMLLNITAGPDLRLHDATAAAQVLEEHAHDEAEIAFGVVTDPAMQGRVRVTLIATGLSKKPRNALVLLDRSA